jgi:predicted dienelactone hydrolase
MRFFLCLIVLFGSLNAFSKAPAPAQERAENIGVRTFKYVDLKRDRPVLVELWYPTLHTGPFDEPIDTAWIHPKEIRDVPICEGKFPLVLMSHGHGGDRRDRSWLAEFLVKNGFVVASIEHHGNSRRTMNPILSIRFWERARDVSFTIDEILKDSFLKTRIDPKRIGFVGYSMGGMTGLALAGGIAQNVKEIVKSQIASSGHFDPRLVDKIDFSEAQKDFSDRRIGAMVLLSPATFVFPPNSLKNLKVPVALVASEGDEVLPHHEHAFKIITHLVPRKLMLLGDKASHYVFLNRVSEVGKELINEYVHTAEIELDRLTVHKKVGAFVSDFFREQLLGKISF